MTPLVYKGALWIACTYQKSNPWLLMCMPLYRGYHATALYNSITDEDIHNKRISKQFAYIWYVFNHNYMYSALSCALQIIYAPLWEPYLYWDKSFGVHCPRDSSKLSPHSKPDSCQWLMSLHLRVPVNTELVNPTVDWNAAQHAVTHKEGLVWFCNSCASQPPESHKIAVTFSTISILNKSSNQLRVSVPFLLRSQKNWHLLSAKHHHFS